MQISFRRQRERKNWGGGGGGGEGRRQTDRGREGGRESKQRKDR